MRALYPQVRGCSSDYVCFFTVQLLNPTISRESIPNYLLTISGQGNATGQRPEADGARRPCGPGGEWGDVPWACRWCDCAHAYLSCALRAKRGEKKKVCACVPGVQGHPLYLPRALE